MSLRIEPLARGQLDRAAALLAASHARRRAVEPALPERYADESVARGLVRAELEAPGSVAMGAWDGGSLAGYLVAEVLRVPPSSRGALYAPAVGAWFDWGGWALRPGDEPRTLRLLYAAVARELVEQGVRTHAVHAVAAERAGVDAWFQLGFGLEQARGARRSETPPLVTLPDEIEIRHAEPADLVHIVRLSQELARAHQAPPLFLPQTADALAGLAAHHAERLAEPELPDWLALRDGQPVGMLLLDRPRPTPATPDGSVDVAEAYTEPALRGRGVGTALFQTALGWAHEQGHPWLTTAWRTGALEAAVHWPRLGFQPLGLRLVRTVPS